MIYQNRIVLQSALDFGPGHDTGANQAILSSRSASVGGEVLWLFPTGDDRYISAAIPPPGLQDPSTNYPGRFQSLEFVGIRMFCNCNSAIGTDMDFEYGFQSLAEGDAYSNTLGESFTAEVLSFTQLNIIADVAATPVAVEPNEWLGFTFGRIGSTDGSGADFWFRGIILEFDEP
jgi:hypothetical protein